VETLVNRQTWLGLIVVGVLAVSGCSQNIYVRGIREAGVNPIEATTPLYVEVEKGLQDADQDPALAPKIERVLTGKGFSIVPESEAAALLFFQYELEDLVQRKYLRPTSGAGSGMRTVASEGPFVHRLSVSVVRATANPASETSSMDVLWVGGAVLNATSLRTPEVADILIVALFDHFADDTGKTLRVPIRLDDSRAEDLRAAAD